MTSNNIRTDLIKVLFSTLVIRTESIEREFGSLQQFRELCDFKGQENNDLIAIYEMNSPAGNLIQFIEDVLIPQNFIQDKDFALLEEELFFGVERPGIIYRERKPSWSHRLNWLDGIVSEKGNIIWRT